MSALALATNGPTAWTASDRKPPTIHRAEMADFDGDGFADRVHVYMNERVNCPEVKGELSPFVVERYQILKQKETKGRKLVVLTLKEKKEEDGAASPLIEYLPHVAPAESACEDLAGNFAVKSKAPALPMDPNATIDIEARALFEGKLTGLKELDCSGAFLKVDGRAITGQIDNSPVRRCNTVFKDAPVYGKAFRILFVGAIGGSVPVGGCRNIGKNGWQDPDFEIEVSAAGFKRCGVLP
jgi:hypothetical protein